MEKARESNIVKTQNSEIDLIDLVKIIYKGKKVVIILTILGALVGAGLGWNFDRNIKETYTAAIEFMYMPKKIESSEELKVYAFDVYILNSLLKKDGIITETGGYQTPTITLGDNAVRFNQNDRYSYRLYTVEEVEKSAIQKTKQSYEKFLEEAALLDYNKNKFYKLNEKVEVIKHRKKQRLFLILGMVLGIFFGVMAVFLKEFFIYLKNEIKKND